MKDEKKIAMYFWLAVVCFAFMYFAGSEIITWRHSKTGEFKMSHTGVLVALAITAGLITAFIVIKPATLTKLYLRSDADIKRQFIGLGMPIPESTIAESEVDPADLPNELHTANIAFRAVKNGHGDRTATPKNRLIDYLEKNFTDLKPEAVKRIATVANPDKSTGRKKSNKE